MPGESKKISELESASSLNNGDLLELASVNALSETGYSSKKTTVADVANKIATLNPQAQADWTESDNTDPSYIQNKPTLATVATSGSYNDLSNKPEIPAAQVNSDWNSSSGVSAILNKPTLGTSASKDVGVANGVAELDANGLVPTSQLPAYVDDVLEYASQSAFPATGETGKIYVALDTNLTYRWGGSAYVEISPSLALGETSSTAYAGNKGKANADAISAIQTTLSGLATVATTGDYNDLTNKPAINDATITFTQGGTTKGTITLNQAADATIALDAGGGGSGGHTILDDEGTSLTQRNDLQFKGAYSVDNNTDQITEVNVVREMTALEFEQLTDAEKVGIINVTDATSSGDNEFQPIIYSEEEREIGVWKDGKPLYEKTLSISTLVSGTYTTVPYNIDDIDYIFIHNAVTQFVVNNNIVYGTSMPYVSSPSSEQFCVDVNTNADSVGYICGIALAGGSAIVVLRYTKTTDQAGSGTWTPQGVPAVHYSEDEHVVGTWIDGKTLYEKTVVYSGNIGHGSYATIDNSLSYSGVGFFTVLNASAKLATVDTWFTYSVGGQNYDIALSDALGVYVENFSSTYNISDVVVTIRYTKSST